MILIEKKQSGGRLFAPAQIDFGVRDFSQLLKGYGGGGGHRQSVGRPSKAKSSEPDVNKGLKSDVTYYSNKRQALLNKMEQGFSANDNYDTTNEYNTILHELYNLETSAKASLDSMKKTYDGAITNMRSKEFGQAPAVMGHEVLVKDINGEYGIISDVELLKNPKAYEIQNMATAADRRAVDPRFNGFEGGMGTFVDKMLNQGFGIKQFDNYILGQVKHSGYTSNDGILRDHNGNKIDLNDVQFNGSGTRFKAKSNSKQLEDLIDKVEGTANSPAKNFIDANALFSLHSKAKNGNIDTKDLTLPQLDNLINSNSRTYLLDTLRPMITEEYKLGKPTKEGSGSVRKGSDKLWVNPVSLSLVTLAKNTKSIESAAGLDQGSKKGSLIFDVPTSIVPQVNVSIIEDDGYKEAGKSFDDKNANMSEKGKPIIANKVLRDTGHLKNLTLADGTKIANTVYDNKGLRGVTTDPYSNWYFMLAPIENGETVNFDSKFIKNTAEVIQYSEDLAKQMNISPEDMESGKSNSKVQEWISKVNAKAKFIPNSNVRFGLATAIQVMYTPKRGEENDYQVGLTDSEKEMLNDRVDDSSRRSVKATAFMPVKESFYDVVLSPEAFGNESKISYTLDAFESMTTGHVPRSDQITTKNLTETMKYEQGGKLPSDEDITNFLKN